MRKKRYFFRNYRFIGFLGDIFTPFSEENHNFRNEIIIDKAFNRFWGIDIANMRMVLWSLYLKKFKKLIITCNFDLNMI